MIKRVIHFVLIVWVLFLLPSVLFAATIEDVVPTLTANQITQLRNGDLVKGASFSDDVTQIVPQDTIAATYVRSTLQKPESFTVVSLSYVPYPEHMKNMSEAQRQVEIFNTIRSISTQEGITYISHRAGNKPKELFEKSWYIESEKGRRSIPDPISTTVPQTAEYYVFQRDSSFGSNRYSHSYETNESEIFLEVKNLETMRVFSIFKAVDEQNLAIAMSTYQLEDGLLLTAMATIEGRDPTVKVLGISVDLPSAFVRRTTALGEWFVDRLYN